MHYCNVFRTWSSQDDLHSLWCNFPHFILEWNLNYRASSVFGVMLQYEVVLSWLARSSKCSWSRCSLYWIWLIRILTLRTIHVVNQYKSIICDLIFTNIEIYCAEDSYVPLSTSAIKRHIYFWMVMYSVNYLTKYNPLSKQHLVPVFVMGVSKNQDESSRSSCLIKYYFHHRIFKEIDALIIVFPSSQFRHRLPALENCYDTAIICRIPGVER